MSTFQDTVPPWDKAPLWAKWRACDISGDWYWYANEPKMSAGGFWFPAKYGRMACAYTEPGIVDVIDWDQSKEKRP